MDRLLAHTLFCRVVELGSFTAAAREARLPQPTVSRHIASLEESLATRLLERTTRTLSVTETGQAVVERDRYLAAIAAVRAERQCMDYLV